MDDNGYVQQEWEDLPSEETPVCAERLNHMEAGIKQNSDDIAEIRKKVPMKTSQLENDNGFLTSVPTASTTTMGGVMVDGETITIDEDGTISAAGGGGSVPIASETVAGKVKVDGTTITIDADGTIHAKSAQELEESLLEGAS